MEAAAAAANTTLAEPIKVSVNGLVGGDFVIVIILVVVVFLSNNSGFDG